VRIVNGPRPASGPTRSQAGSQGREAPRAGATARAPDTAASALVAVEPVAETDAPRLFRRYRPNAPFLAQLIATHENLPQMRALRRAPADHALERYRTTERAPRHLDAGRLLAVSR